MNQLFRLPKAKHAGWWIAVVVIQRRLKPMEQHVEEAGLVCEVIGSAPPFTRVLHCQLP